MLQLEQLHHIAIICSDYQKSKHFYCELLGFEIMAETYRAERQSHKLDLSLNGQYLIELFSFPAPPPRNTNPEATGLRHICFQVPDLEAAVSYLSKAHVSTEPIRTDEYTGKRFTFFRDPDDLPIELYEK